MPRVKIERSYQHYVGDYKQYLRLRGYGDHLNDRAFFKRSFLECWLETGFHRFWQVWNPGIGYFVYKLYIVFGGNKRKAPATIAAFLINGLIHNLVVILFMRRWDFPLPFTFLSFGVFTVVFRWLDRFVEMDKLPRVLHLAINVGLVVISFDFGFAMNDLIK